MNNDRIQEEVEAGAEKGGARGPDRRGRHGLPGCGGGDAIDFNFLLALLEIPIVDLKTI